MKAGYVMVVIAATLRVVAELWEHVPEWLLFVLWTLLACCVLLYIWINAPEIAKILRDERDEY